MSATDNTAVIEEEKNEIPEENIEIPDDFFDEFEDSKFLDEIIEIDVPEQSRLIREDGVVDGSTTKSVNQQPNEEEPVLKRCLDQIDNLEKSIERRKRILRGETHNNGSKRKRYRSHSKSPSTSRVESSRSDRNVRSRDRRVSPRPSPGRSRTERSKERSKGRSRGRSRSRERSRSRDRDRDRRLSRNRRDRTTSPVQPRNMSFLEELEQKFAEKGQDFPEKDLLIQLRENGTSGLNQYAVATGYPQCEVPILMPPYMQMPMPMPIYNQPYPPQWNGTYMMDPMLTVSHGIQHPPLALPYTNGMNSNMIQNSSRPVDQKPPNKAEVVAKCRAAIKILRSEENKVPKLRFLFTRTSTPATAEQQIPPLQSRKNVEFQLTSENQQSFAPLQFLPTRTRELVKILGYNCSHILERLRLKEFADKVVHEIDDAEKKRNEKRSFKECESQTESYKCPNCVNRETKVYSNKCAQTEMPKKVSIRTQTNEKDYREPLIRSLSWMTPGQLVAITDFAELICQPRPSTSNDVYNIREKLMDIYNLSERGTEAIEAERELEQMRRRPIALEDLRASLRGSSDQNMGRVPPPPPLLTNYHMDHIDVGMLAAQEDERFRLEENRRFQLEEQRHRELEWEHQQRVQQRQLQLQREQESENLNLELRNDRRNQLGRGQNNWNGGRGRNRY